MDNPAIETIEYKDHTIEIFQDIYPDNPRSWDNLTEIHAWHKRINIGDKECNYYLYEQYEKDRLDTVLKEAKKNRDIVLPLYIYQHSGITIRLTPFNCQWDSGQVGWVIVRRKKILDEWKAKRLTKQLKEKVMKVIEGEIKTYDDYFVGNVYGYVIDDGDSCWGYYGDYNHPDYGAIVEAKGVVDSIVEYEKKRDKLFKKIAKWSQENHLSDLDIITHIMEKDDSCDNNKDKAVKLLEEYRQYRKGELVETWSKEFEGKELRDIEKLVVKVKQY